MVVDVDNKKGKSGDGALLAWQLDNEDLPDTFTVETPSGGRHLYFWADRPVPNSAGKLGVGIDVRGRGGYVVAPGSCTEAGAYSVSSNRPIAGAPLCLVEAVGRARERSGAVADVTVELDTPAAVERARGWLEAAEPAVEGAGGDHRAFVVASRLKDFGVSEHAALDLMLEHWNDRCAPPWDVDDLQTKVQNAYRYGQNAIGVANPEAEFEAVEISKPDGMRDGKWPDPGDLWEEQHAPQDLPPGILPAYVEKFARDRALRIGVDPGAMAAATVTALSSLIPAGIKIHLRQHSDEWNISCILWTAIVGDPGTAKSPAVKAAMAFPKSIERQWREQYALEKQAFDETLPPVSDRKRRGRKQHRVEPNAPQESETSSSAIEPDFEQISQPSLREPLLRRKITNDATTEALAGLLAKNSTSAPILYFSEELTGLLGGLDAYRARAGKDRPFFLEAKEGDTYTVDRKGAESLSVLHNAIAILGTIQEDKLGRIASGLTDDGLLQRFSLVKIHRTGHGSDIPADRILDQSIPRVASALADLEIVDYRLSIDAGAELEKIQEFASRECERVDLPSSLKQWLNKTPNEFGRYALAFHLIDWAASVSPLLGDPPAGLIPADTAERARRYIQGFLYGHALYAYRTLMTRTPDVEDARWIAGYILARASPHVTAREIGRAYRQLSNDAGRVRLQAAMGTLSLQGWVEQQGAGARLKWIVNPRVHDGRFRALADQERNRRAEVRADIALNAGRRRVLASVSGVT